MQKKIIIRIVIVLAALIVAVWLPRVIGSSGSERLYVFNWGDYIDEDVIDLFEEQTGIRVIYETFDTNESMYAKIKPGNAPYDVAIPSDYMIEKMINEDMLEKIDFNNVPNFRYIDDRFKSQPYDPNNEYSAAYMWGTVGILYNTEMTDDDVTSWDILWDEKYAGMIYMYDSMRDAFAPALKKLGFSLNTRDIGELNLAKEELIRQKPLVQAYLGDSVKDKMIGGEGALAVVYSGDAMYAMEENEDLDYAVPAEGSNLWCDAAVILKGAKNKENAEKFINFLCDPQIALMNTLYIGYSTTNAAAFEMLPEDIKQDETYWPPEDVLAKCEFFVDLGDFVTEFDRAWTEVLAAGR